MSAPKRIPAHAERNDPFAALVRAGADAGKLNRLLAWVEVGAELEKRFEGKKRRKGKLRRAEEARLRRIPGQLRAKADDIAKLISRLDIDPRRLVPHASPTQRDSTKLRLKDKVAEVQEYSANRKLVGEWVNIPSSLYGLAYYLEICRARRSLTQPARPDNLLRRAKVTLLDYVKSATGRAHYQEVADLLTEALANDGSGRIVTADDLRKLSNRNPRLRLPPSLFT